MDVYKRKRIAPYTNLFNPINVTLTGVLLLDRDQGRGWRGLKELDLGADTAPKWLNVLQIRGNLPLLEFIPNKSIKSTILMNILYSYDTVRPI